MYKWLKKSKIYQFISAMLVAIFVFNVSGCGKPEPNGVDGGEKGGITNYSVGVGSNIDAYSIYSQSTFDQMNENLFQGYLLYERSFILVVLPGEGDGSDDHPYKFNGNLVDYSDNVLYSSAKAGVYEYNNQGTTVDKTQKLLMYYVTQAELNSWFQHASNNDNLFTKAYDFFSGTYDLDESRHFNCHDLVNLGSGLNADTFCGTKNSNGILQNSRGDFNDLKTGGLILFFGEKSIEGYMNYNHINNFTDGNLINGLMNCRYTYVNGPFNFDEMLRIDSVKKSVKDLYDEEITKEIVVGDDSIKQALIGAYTEYEYLNASNPCKRLQATFTLIERALITDAQEKNYGSQYRNLASLRSLYTSKANAASTIEEKEQYMALLDMIKMFDGFNDSKRDEAFNLKFSIAMYSRVNKLISVSSTGVLSNKGSYTDVIELSKESATDLDKAIKLSNGNAGESDYLLLVTGEGFLYDRGTESEQVALGAADMLGYSEILRELVRMDACPNESVAAKFFDMLATLKIIAGSALTIAGAAITAFSGIIATVILKIAIAAGVTPVPGARIVAAALVVIAGLIALGAGLFTLFSGIKDKARLKGMGASDKDYCATYNATIKQLLSQITINIPVYHYTIPKDNTDASRDLALNYCPVGEYDENLRTCVDENGKKTNDPRSLNLYYYANREISNKINVDGLPALLYFSNGRLVDEIYGATTPEFIVESLRIWGVLAMREMLYSLRAKDNTATLSHTSNSAVRTLDIKDVRYCYTIDYNTNLYGDNVDSSLCMFEKTTTKYFSQSINANWEGKTSGDVISVDVTSSRDYIEQNISAKYSDYFKDTNKYKFSSAVISTFKAGSSNISYGISETTKCSAFSDGTWSEPEMCLASLIATYGSTKKHIRVYVDESNPDFYLEGEVVQAYNETSKRYEYYLLGDESIYRLDLSNAMKIVLVKEYKDGKVFNDFVNDLYRITDDEGKVIFQDDIESRRILNYLSGVETIEEKEDATQNTSIPLYFTISVRELDHSTGNENKTCDADKGDFLYTKNSNGSYKCMAPSSADNSKFTPVKQENIYTTSVVAANLIVSNTIDGVEVKVEWTNGFERHE